MCGQVAREQVVQDGASVRLCAFERICGCCHEQLAVFVSSINGSGGLQVTYQVLICEVASAAVFVSSINGSGGFQVTYQWLERDLEVVWCVAEHTGGGERGRRLPALRGEGDADEVLGCGEDQWQIVDLLQSSPGQLRSLTRLLG